MPHAGAGHGWHGGRGVRRGQVSRMLEPCLLILLQGQPCHGYDLLHALDRFGLDPELLDTGLVYRSLRQMEMGGWIRSEWDVSGTGPAKRVYTITPDGEQALASWKSELESTHSMLHRLLGLEDHAL